MMLTMATKKMKRVVLVQYVGKYDWLRSSLWILIVMMTRTTTNILIRYGTSTAEATPYATTSTSTSTRRAMEEEDQQQLSDDLSNQIMYNVIMNLENILSSVVLNVKRMKAVRDNKGFRYGMTAPDRDFIYSVLGSTRPRQIGSNVYYGLEDGTYFGSGYLEVSYREPGLSGYNVSHIQSDDPNYKHYISCVNSTSGDERNCTMEETMQYITCINDCEPILCNTSLNENKVAHDIDADEHINYFCRSYETTVVPVDNSFHLGYIPTTHYCINQYNQPEQELGKMVWDYDAYGNVDVFGDCLYYDQYTYVNRSLQGNYAYCGTKNQTCDTTFMGGFYEDEFDPRIRPWYIQTKLAQTSIWTEPFLNPGGTHLSITYNHPIYTTEILENNTIMNHLFEGVLGQSYDLSVLSELLKDSTFHIPGSRVFVLEQQEPYYLIGTTIHSFQYGMVQFGNDVVMNMTEYRTFSGNVTDGITKWVLATNHSQLCPYLHGSNPFEVTIENPTYLDLCTTVRISIHEFFDPISYRAFQEYYNMNFIPNPLGIYYKVDDNAVGTSAYVAYTKSYTKENLQWQVFVISDVKRSSTDAILKGTLLFTMICIIATIGFGTCFIMFYCFYQRRTQKAIIHADWRFTCAFIIGCAMVNISSYALLGDNTNQLCMLRMWSFNVLFVCGK
jgi:hypothetical protein